MLRTQHYLYTYDGLQRLTAADETSASPTDYTYSYDNAGNRTGVWVNGTRTVTQTYNAANQVVGYSYDAAGNLTSDGTTTRTWDALGRMLSSGSTTYAYNGDGVLVAQTASSVTTRYTQDLGSPLSQILSDGTNCYIYGHERLFGQAGSTRTWYTGDALGSVRQTLSDSGSVLGSANYDPWGTPQGGSIASFGFTGELQQGDSVYLRARWYTPGSGMLLGRDPFEGFAEQPYSLMPYQYGYSNPVLWSDPSGTCIAQKEYNVLWTDFKVVIGEENCEQIPIESLEDLKKLNFSDAKNRLWNTVENVGIIGAIVGDEINARRGQPTHNAQRIANEDPIAGFLGNTFTTLAFAGGPMLGVRAKLGEIVTREGFILDRLAFQAARLKMARSDIALLSGLSSMGGSVVGQVIGNICEGNPSFRINWGDAGIAGNIGSVAGFFAPWTAVRPDANKLIQWGARIRVGTLGATSNSLQYAITQLAHRQPFDWTETAWSSAWGFAGGVAGGSAASPRREGFNWEAVYQQANVSVNAFTRSLGSSALTSTDFEAIWKAILDN